jgi:hypothetical protein
LIRPAVAHLTGVRLLRALGYYLVASVVLLPFVALLFGAAVTHYSYLVIAGLVPALALALALHRGALALAGHGSWAPTRRTMGWVAASIAWVSVAGAVVARSPVPVGLLAAATSGWLNACALQVLRSAEEPRPSRRCTLRRMVVPVAVAVTFSTVVLGASVGFASAHQSSAGTGAVLPADAAGTPVLFASGFDSVWRPPPLVDLPPGDVGWRYSYRGVTADGKFLSYSERDTLQPLGVSAARLAEEVGRLFAVYHRPVILVAESEGAMVARLYLLRDYSPSSGQVVELIILDMPRGPTHVSYPTIGREGWGLGSGWMLRGIVSAIHAVGPVTVSADAPFIRDLVDRPAILTELAVAPPPSGVRQIAIDALADAVTSPQRTQSGNETVVAAMHGGLMGNPHVDHLISRVLAGEPIGSATGLRALQHGIALVATPWQVPSLPDGWRG